jgi:hypothetical protein
MNRIRRVNREWMNSQRQRSTIGVIAGRNIALSPMTTTSTNVSIGLNPSPEEPTTSPSTTTNGSIDQSSISMRTNRSSNESLLLTPQINGMNGNIVELQQQKIRELEATIEEINRERYCIVLSSGAQGKNHTRTAKKISMTTQDQINQQAVSCFLRELIWSSQKILPKNWTKYRDDSNSLCQLILRKISTPRGVDRKTYWEGMLLGITNDKFCSLRSNFKQDLFEQFKGKIEHYNC